MWRRFTLLEYPACPVIINSNGVKKHRPRKTSGLLRGGDGIQKDYPFFHTGYKAPCEPRSYFNKQRGETLTGFTIINFPWIRKRLYALGAVFFMALFVLTSGDVWAKTKGEFFIKKLEFIGVHQVPIAAVKKGIVTEEPSWRPWIPHPVFDETTLKKDIKRIESIYRDYGYYHAKAQYRLQKDLKKKMVKVKIMVDEGKPTLIKKIGIITSEEDGKKWEECFLKAISLKIGEPFKVDTYEESKERIRKTLANKGYSDAKVSGRVVIDKRHYQANITFTVDPGPLTYFGPVTIVGNKEVKGHVILGELTFKEGEVFSLKKVYESQQNIYKLGLFKSVILRSLGAKQGIEIPIQVAVEERKKRNLKVGVGYGDEDEFRAQIAWSRKNFLGNLRDLDIAFKYSSLIRTGTMDFTQPYFIDRDSNLGIHFGYDREYLESYTNERISSQVKVGRNLARNVEGFIAYNLELNRPVGIGEATIEELKETERGKFYWISGGEIGLRRDTIENSLDPQKGSVFSVFLEPAIFLLGSGVDYLKGVIEARVYRRIIPGLTLASRLKLGFIQPYGDTKEAPIFKRFFSGGSNSIRGYPFQEIGPLDKEGNPIGGHSLIEGNLELRHSMFRDIKGVAFLDAGNVSRDSFNFRMSELRFSAGWGIRYHTLVGPIRLDLAFPLNPPPERDMSLCRFHFSIGHAF